MRDILKRKFAEVEENPCYSPPSSFCSSSSSSSSSSASPSSLSSPTSSEWESDGEGSSSENQDFTPHSPASASGSPIWPILKKPKLSKRPNSVRFDQVTVFSFPRSQGFTSVPSRGGATLGMVRKHSALRRYTVDEHAVEQRSRRRERHREKLIQERFEALKHQLIISGAVDQNEAEKLTTDQVLGGDPDIHVSESDLEDGGYLQPFSSKQRQALLLAAGAKVIDKEEKRQLHALRLSREACGCDCRGFCEPETCACSQAGIKCQVDRFNFPCGCTKDSCGNVQGRIEFDARRVQTHYIHTLMRLELQRRLRRETLVSGEQAGVTEELRDCSGHNEVSAEQSAQESRCPFRSGLEEDLLPFAMPAAPSFRCIPDQLVVEENSCSSDMSESSLSSSECDAGQFFSGTQTLPDRGADLTHDSGNKNFFSCAQNRHRCSSATSDDDRPHSPVALADNIDASRNYLDENANQSRDFFNEDSFEDFPNTPSPTVGYSFSGYMDLSLSSDSDLEFFHRDYPSGPLHSSFKEHRHSDSFQHFQLFSSVNLPQQESSIQLLESLIG
ncbi:cysteine/serine-rich nuclear protein 2-like [Xiphophorus maculatus]|uniref:Cysteine and serine rich nuclear protein 1 n=1 Tax=Xiphophorus maculatus TaxID=8083 RepID=A0A3B5QLG7_XIPMA|nr:cysteine/serine-rich nuclear protein 2-like [Xiphophorus maculatus]